MRALTHLIQEVVIGKDLYEGRDPSAMIEMENENLDAKDTEIEQMLSLVSQKCN